jgi:cytidylate kinase
MSERLVVAIDGPAGSGKSTLGRALAVELGLSTLDTGATYRAIAARALDLGLDIHDESAVEAVAEGAELQIGDRVTIDGKDVTQEIRSDAVNAAVSVIAAHQRVRSVLVRWQRAWTESHGGGIVEGRDIGSVVFPDATVKLYLTARAEERARRRPEEGQESIDRRDLLDSTRAASPLTAAEGARIIDTTEVPVEEVVKMVLEMVEEARGAKRD